jgi:hypothetical protein
VSAEEQWPEEGEPVACHCLCAAIHPGEALCNTETPQALVLLDTSGTQREAAGPRVVVMCRPCGKATMMYHPRALDLVVFEVRERSAP